MALLRCWFDAKKRAKGIEALRQYQREYDDKLKTFKARPRHDWASHGADAFRYLTIGLPEAFADKYEIPKRNPNRSWMSAWVCKADLRLN